MKTETKVKPMKKTYTINDYSFSLNGDNQFGAVEDIMKSFDENDFFNQVVENINEEVEVLKSGNVPPLADMMKKLIIASAITFADEQGQPIGSIA